MRIVEPGVYVLAMTKMVTDDEVYDPPNSHFPQEFKGNLQQYLMKVGADNWKTTPCADGELLIEVAGRLCYKAFGLGQNANVTRVREGNKVYLDNLAKQDHGSVQEHSSITFLFTDVSRILTHELARHRVGVAISQESGRYVRADDIGFYMPSCFNGAVSEAIKRHIENGETLAVSIAKLFKLDDPATSFSSKKEITSAIRRFAPLGHASSLVWTTNHRNLRFVLQKRTEGGAEEEIRRLFDPIGHGMKQMFPNLYQDIYRRSNGEWVSTHSIRGLVDRLRTMVRDGDVSPENLEYILRERGL